MTGNVHAKECMEGTPDWGGGPHCQVCRCRKHHYHTRQGEVWMFDWCYHDVAESEPVRLLASVFYMFNEPRPATA